MTVVDDGLRVLFSSSVIAEKQQKTVGRDDPARRLAVGKGMQLPANGTPSGRALQKHVHKAAFFCRY